MFRRILLALIPLLLCAGIASAQSCDAPKGSVNPGAADGIVGSAASFAGTWQGQWPIAVHGHVVPVCAKLSIFVASSQAATVDQCIGSNSEGRLKAVCKQFSAQIDDNVMTFTDSDGTVYTFTMADVGGMKGEAISAKHRSVTVFTRMN